MKKKSILMGSLIAIVMSRHFVAFGAANTSFPLKSSLGSTIEYNENKDFNVEEFTENENVAKNEDIAHYKSLPILDKEQEEEIIQKILKEAEQYPIYIYGELEIPGIEEGMTAYYDGMGDLTKIVDKDGNSVPLYAKLEETIYPEGYNLRSYTNNGTYKWPSSTNKNVLTRTNDSVLATGWVTWYDGVGKIGNHDNILTNDDCATAMSYDRPPSDTAIYVRNLENDNADYVCKNDVGGLPNAILDIMPDKMRDTFGSTVNKNAGTDRFDGRYFYYR